MNNPKKKIIIISAICGLTSLIIIFFVIYPLIKEVRENSHELTYLRKEFELSQNQEENLAELKKFYNKVEPDFAKMNDLLTEPEVPIDLIKFLEKTAKEQEILIDISPAGSKKEESNLWNYISFQINVRGSFTDFLRFIEKIESGPFLLEITNLSVNKSDIIIQDKKVPNGVSANLLIKVFTK